MIISVLIPIALFTGIIYNVVKLDANLVRIQATITDFKKKWAGARSDRINDFKTEEYPAVFSRSYSGISRLLGKNIRSNLFEIPVNATSADIAVSNYPLKPKQDRQVVFYVQSAEVKQISEKQNQPTYFYLKMKGDKTSSLGYYADLYAYVSKSKIGIGVIIVSLIASVIMFGYAMKDVENRSWQLNYLKVLGAIYLFIILF
ncbi:hypothetical protein [Mucilaginibacter lacusdianchii]|uniref:hypothetical protein n=1 Tax=Mucilaginibacter lacusdianchii TaxID=2684211 RepID=UPI00131E8A6F|nr:hypothetical protein [Mucilaginibacter sp. JXJ CY 39]